MNDHAATKAGQLQAIIAAGRRIHAAVDALDRSASERLGVHRSDLRCLMLLEAGPCSAGHVAGATGLTSGSVTALLDRLEGVGFVERRRSCTDRRSVEVAMPDDRLAEMAAVAAQIEGAIHDHFAGRGVAELAAIAAALAAFAVALGSARASLDAG